MSESLQNPYYSSEVIFNMNLNLLIFYFKKAFIECAYTHTSMLQKRGYHHTWVGRHGVCRIPRKGGGLGIFGHFYFRMKIINCKTLITTSMLYGIFIFVNL